MAKLKKKATGKKAATPQGVRTPRGGQASANSGGKIVLATLTIGALGVLGYLGWRYVRGRRSKNNTNLDELLLKPLPGGTSQPGGSTIPPLQMDPLPGGFPIPDATMTPPVSDSKGGSRKRAGSTREGFPLRRGSKGDNVRILQEALIRKYGANILPKYGADGSFGAEMVAALRKLKMPGTISETFFNVLTQSTGSNSASTGTDLSALSGKLYNATMRRDFATVLSLLGNIKSSADYTTVSNGFQQYRINGVRQTLVNGLLNVFSADSQKQQLRLAFATIGLQYDGNRWAISGLNGPPIITVIPTKIWVTPTMAVDVPARMLLGQEVARRLQYVLFANGGRHFLVHQNSIRHL